MQIDEEKNLVVSSCEFNGYLTIVWKGMINCFINHKWVPKISPTHNASEKKCDCWLFPNDSPYTFFLQFIHCMPNLTKQFEMWNDLMVLDLLLYFEKEVLFRCLDHPGRIVCYSSEKQFVFDDTIHLCRKRFFFQYNLILSNQRNDIQRSS